jgi:DNA repair protein RecO (recombination protein O)
MPVRESEAIILRTFALGEGDRLVSFLSRTEGRLRGVASGARRPKSRFGSTLEALSYIRIWFYERETRELVRISQCDLIESFLEVQRDYATGLALALLREITEAVLGEREVADANFRLLLLVARAIKAGAKASLPVAYFAFWTVRLGGWLPGLERCARCGAELKQGAYLSEGSGLFCGACRLPGHRVISPEALKLGREMMSEKLEQLITSATAPATVCEVKDHMLNLIERHIDRKLQARTLLEQNLESPF